MEQLLFVGLDTLTIDDGAQGVVLDLSSVGFTPDGDDFFDDSDLHALATEHGVSLADLWAAYQWRQSLLRAGVLADVERMVEAVLA